MLDFDAARKILAKALQGADSHANDIESIETAPFWKTQDAVAAFREYTEGKHRKPVQNYDYFLREFNVHFADRNMAEITPAEVEEFLYTKWGDKSGSTWNQSRSRASSLFSFCIKELKCKESPSFYNPCGLIDDVPVGKKERKEFIRIDKMRQLLDTFDKPHHWLMFHILVTAGLRIEELTCLRPMDVNGRVLKIATYTDEDGREVGLESKRLEEYAVIPQMVADRLKTFMQGMPEDKPIFPYSHVSIRDVLATHCKWVYMDRLKPHDLRKWVASFWERHGYTQMVNFIMRPSLGSRAEIYVNIISAEEAMVRQDQVMTPALIDNLQTPEI